MEKLNSGIEFSLTVSLPSLIHQFISCFIYTQNSKCLESSVESISLCEILLDLGAFIFPEFSRIDGGWNQDKNGTAFLLYDGW